MHNGEKLQDIETDGCKSVGRDGLEGRYPQEGRFI